MIGWRIYAAVRAFLNGWRDASPEAACLWKAVVEAFLVLGALVSNYSTAREVLTQ